MKTHLNFIRKICTWTFLAALVGLASVAQGQVPQLVITEYSSSSLTATLDGSSWSVTSQGANEWLVFTPGFVLPEDIGWKDAENPTTEANFVESITPGIDLIVSTDQPVVSTATGFLANGETDQGDFTYNAGPLDVTFNDDEGATSAPDAAGTFSLLALSMAALMILKRSQSFSLPAA